MPVGTIVHRLASVPSTNDAARTLALQGAVHGTAVLAREQTQGRGTKGRDWHSPAILGLYASFILRGPGGGAVPFPHILPLAAGLAVSDAVREASGIATLLKWPNDIIHDGKKLGGILSEGVSGGPAGDFAVVGIGVNVGHAAGDFPESLRATSTSLKLAGSPETTVEGLFRALCPALDRWYNVLARGDKEAVIRAFEAKPAFPPGALVKVETLEGPFTGEYRGLDAEGRLIVSRSGGAGTVALVAVLGLERAS
jgi:BirA family transcriptional regulator, biotin operon repressor / biotin---[acetyl-CoA-carboxylase] ligase